MTTLVLSKPFSEIHAEAKAAAEQAAADMFAKYGNKDAFPCGFAWVNVYNVKLSTKIGKEFAKEGFSKSYTKGIELWNPSGYSVQNVNVKAAGANAYAAVLRKYGIDASWSDRLD